MSQVKSYLLQMQVAIEALQISLESALAEIDEKSPQKKVKPVKGMHPELQDPKLEPLLKKCTLELQKDWLLLYNQDSAWIKAEIMKAQHWSLAKNKTHKSVGLFLANWLRRAWEMKHPETKEAVGNVTFYNPEY